MHASAQPKRVCVQHWIIWVDHLTQVTKLIANAFGIWRLACRLRLRRRCHSHWRTCRRLVVIVACRVGVVELRRVVAMQLARRWVGCIVGIGLVEHGSRLLGIVLLFCTHESNLGRTQFYREDRGQLAELIYVFLKWTGIVLSGRRARITRDGTHSGA